MRKVCLFFVVIVVMVATATIANGRIVVLPDNGDDDGYNEDCPSAPSECASIVSGINLSKMISDTYPITKKCPPINGEKSIQLLKDTPAKVYFKTKGWQTGYLREGETVYYNPNTLCMTRMVRCGNPAQGKVELPKEKVRIKTRTIKSCSQKVIVQPAPSPPPPPPAPPITVTNVSYNIGNTATPSMPIGGFSGGSISSLQIAGIGFSPRVKQEVCVTTKVTNNIAVAVTDTIVNNNVLNGGSGTATGNATGKGSSVAGSGNTVVPSAEPSK